MREKMKSQVRKMNLNPYLLKSLLSLRASSGKSRKLGKWPRVFDNLVKDLSKVGYILGREIRAASSNIS